MFGQAKQKTAWMYHRHSAEDKQENSVPIQREKAQAFCDKYNIKIVGEFADEGKSGLSANRPAFESLFRDFVKNPQREKVDYIIVHDVSRWGRFQDPDEPAYWTMLCKQQGIKVIYVEEGFPAEDQLLNSSLQTQLKRYMAAEYSRQLSSKVFYGSAKVAEQGFSPGGTANYGLTRVLLDENKQYKQLLKRGEHKLIANQRVTFAPSNDEQSIAVKQMFDELIDQWKHPSDIAATLNEESIFTLSGKEWDSSKVINILGNERYAGTMVYNKTWKRLKQPGKRNPESEWVRCENAFEGIVSLDRFRLAQERLYWMLPYRHRYGVNKIKATHRAFMKYLEEHNESIGTDDRFLLKQGFPVSFGVKFYQEDKVKQCFQIDETKRKLEEVICVGVDMFNTTKPPTIYKIPQRLFGVGDYLVVSDNDSRYRDCVLSSDDVAEEVSSISKLLLVN